MRSNKRGFFTKLSLLMREHGVVNMPITQISFNDMHVWSIAYNHGLTCTPTNHNPQYTIKSLEGYGLPSVRTVEIMKITNYTKLHCLRGAGYRNVAEWSHYNEPVDHTEGRPAGNSRRWGDAPHDVQKQVIDALVAECESRGLTVRETAHVLAIARVESGFNPDAAAGRTSASGLGQFIDRTGKAYGLHDSNRFELKANVEALVRHFIDNRDYAERKGYSGREKEEMIYALHHDGPSLEYGGMRLSHNRVMPWVDTIEGLVIC